MSVVQLLLQAEAAAHDRAVPSTAYRHRHIAGAPLVVCAYNLSGEAAAPLAIMYGTALARPKLLVAAEPRNRDSRFAAINTFAADLDQHVSPYLRTETRQGGSAQKTYDYQSAPAAPQIVVPNRATRDYLGARLGRSLRYLGLGDTHPVPRETVWCGAHLSWLAEHAHYPGQSMFLAATELLTRHFATGQSAFEDENLASLLAWINNPADSGLHGIREAEKVLAFGPVSDPGWEAELEPMVRSYSRAIRDGDEVAKARAERRVTKQVRPALATAYRETHAALAIMRAIPPAASVARRWQQDLREWSRYCTRASQGIPRFRTRHDPLRAARMLEEWSHALENLGADEAFDDPLVMAELDAAGQCLSGKVLSVDRDHREVKPGNKNQTLVPQVRLELTGETRLLEGAIVVWADDRRVTANLREIVATKRTGEATLSVMGGHDHGTRLPLVGDTTLFAALTVFGGMSPASPSDVPWTHRPSETDAVDRGAVDYLAA